MKKKFLIVGGIVLLVLFLVLVRCNDIKIDNNLNLNLIVILFSIFFVFNFNNNLVRFELLSKIWDLIYDNSFIGVDIILNVSYKVMFEKYK